MKRLLLFFLIFISGNWVFAQNTATLEINSTLTNTQSSARDLIKIKPGSVIKASSGGNSKVFINKAIELPVSTQASNTTNATTGFLERDLDKSLEVGTVTGSASVSSVGAANYTIPIQLPPGTNGMVPGISISYNHLQKNRGLLGIGWNLTATSSISRCNNDLYHDNRNDNFNFSLNDALSIDGMRLIKSNRNLTNDGDIFYTEEESFSQIESHESGTLIDYFVVKLKDGTIKEYGKMYNSKLYTVTSAVPVSYFLSRVTDKNGNYIDYVYDNTDNEIVLKSIKYTGNVNGLLPYNEVNFYYDEVSNIRTYLYYEKYLNSTKVLREVEVKTESSHTRSYKFNYTDIDGNPFLKEVSETGSGGIEKYNSTLFSYTEETSSVSAITLNENNFIDDINYLDYVKDYSLFDFNNDGKKDIIVFLGSFITGSIPSYIQSIYNTDPINNSTGFEWLEIRVYKNIDGNNFKLNLAANIQDLPNNFLNYYYHNLKKGMPGSSLLEMVDINGDNNEDLLLTTFDPNTVTENELLSEAKLRIYYSNGDMGFVSLSTPNCEIPLLLNKHGITDPSENLASFLLLDINADGKLDVLNYYKGGSNGSYIKAWLDIPNVEPTIIQSVSNYDFSNAFQSNLYNNGRISIVNILNTTYNSYEQLYYNPLNNLFEITSSNFYITPRYRQFASSCAIENDTKFSMFGDFNGDAITDEIVCTNTSNALGNSAVWTVYFYKTNYTNHFYDFSKDISDLGLSYPFGSTNKIFFCRDVNSDGKTDIIEFRANGFNSIINIYYSTGLDFYKKTFNISTPQSNINVCDYQFEFGDLNADGNEDILINNRKLGERPIIIYLNYGAQSGLLKEVLDGLNQSTVFEYESIGKDAQLYSKNNDIYTYPVAFASPNFYVVKKYFTYLPSGIKSEYSYSFKNCLVHKQGKGFIGFTESSVYNSLTDVKAEEVSMMNLTYFKLLPTKSTTTQIGLNITLSEIISNVDLISLTGKRYEVRLKSLINFDKFKNRTILTDLNNYDSYGNIIKKTVTTKGGNAILEIIETNCTYAQFNTWIPSSVTSCTTKVQAINGTSVTDEKTVINTFDYYPNGNLKFQIENANQPNGFKKEYLTYNDFGLCTYEKVSCLSNIPNAKETNFGYDTKGRFMLNSSITADGITYLDSKVIDARWGIPLSETSANGFTTNYFYNSFGRLLRKENYNGIIENYNTNWANGSELSSDNTLSYQQPFYFTEVQITNEPTVVTYYNKLGQTLRSESDNLTGKIYSGNEYDTKGRLKKSTNNYELVNPQSQPVFTINNYNELDRIINTQITDDPSVISSGFNLTYTYSIGVNGDETISITNENTGQTTSKVTNALGLSIKSIDDGGTVNYEYYADHKLKSTKIGTVTTNQIAYDAYGNQTSLTEANSGTTSYTYDGFGQLSTQTDAAGQTYTITYDDLGRTKTKTGPEGVYTYTYVASGKALGNLESVTGPNNAITSYVYDDLARITKITEGTTSKNFVTQFTYNQYGKLLTKKYPGNFEVGYEYNTIGLLNKIKQASNGATIWQANSMLPNGIINKYTYGNGLLNINTYDNYGNINKQQAGTIFDLEYYINPSSGNMEWRKDNVAQLREEFTYDNLNRLTSFQPTLNANFLQNTIAYKPNGNIDSKTDAGNYIYHPTKINAVESVTNPVTNISLAQQDVTFNSFKKASVITEGNLVYNLTYGINQQRIKSELKNNGITQYTRYYAANFEQTINSGGLVTEVTYIDAPTGLCAMLVNDNSNTQLYYVHTDHLGSINTLTNSSGAIATFNGYLLKQSFDAWGRRRNITNWNYDNLNTLPNWLYRGYTGHEHLYEFSLINMNGRLYDPIVGRMLSPDNYAQSPDYTQSLNRYSYCFNNPLKYTDPTGNIFTLGTFFNDIFSGRNISGANNNHFNGTDFAIEYYKKDLYVMSTITVSVLSVGIAPPLMGSGFWVGAGNGAIMGFGNGLILGSANEFLWKQNNDLKQVAIAGLRSGLKGAFLGAIIGGTTSGIKAYRSGRDFWSGNYTETYLKAHGISLTGDPVDPLDLDEFVNKNFSSEIDAMKNKPTISIDNQAVSSYAKKATAVTIPQNGYDIAGSSDIYLKSSCLQSDKTLFYTLDHELVHASHYSSGQFAIWQANFGHQRAVYNSEFYAYHSGVQLARGWQNPALVDWSLAKMMKYIFR